MKYMGKVDKFIIDAAERSLRGFVGQRKAIIADPILIRTRYSKLLREKRAALFRELFC